jgi:RimJ/RimL family protein N-acetyltransferase
MLPYRADRIVLRRLAVGDLADFQSYRTDPEVGLYQGWSVMADDQALRFLEEVGAATLLLPGEWTQLAISDAETGRLIGDLGIFIDDTGTSAEIGFTLAHSSQRQGLATLAVRAMIDLIFAYTRVGRVLAITDERNTRSVRLLQRVGMSLVSTAPAVWRGAPCVEHTFSIQRPGEPVGQ